MKPPSFLFFMAGGLGKVRGRDVEDGSEGKRETGVSGENRKDDAEKSPSAAVQLMLFVLGFIAFLTFLFYVMGLYDID